jgi:hypothetical protein
LNDTRVRAGLRAQALRSGLFRLDVAFVPELLMTSNNAFVARALASEFRVAPGLETARWIAELDLSLDQSWLTQLSPTSEYRTLAYAGARSGWYGLSSRTIRLGARAAVRVAQFEISVTAGWERTGAFDFFPPFYAVLGGAWSFAEIGGARADEGRSQ